MPAQTDLIRRLHRRLIKARERLSGIRCLELCHRQPSLLLRLLIHIAAPVESCQTISEFSREFDAYLVFVVLLQVVF